MMAMAEPVPISTARRAFRKEGMGYVWEIDSQAIAMRADYLGIRFDEMHGEVVVTLGSKHLHLARISLSGTRQRQTLADALGRLTKGQEIPWERYVEQFCVAVITAERRGEETRHTQATERRRTSYLVDDLVMLGKTNMLFAPGGSGKGYLTIGLCCAVAARIGLASLSVMPAKPIYYDWEDDFETFEERVNIVSNGLGVGVPAIAYRRMRGVVPDRINEMARAAADAGATFGIVDSFSAAGGTVSNGQTWDAIAHRLFDALDQIPGMTWLIIDHVTGASVSDPSGKAFGSIQKMNRVRNAWEMRSEQELGGSAVHMRLFHAKWNHTQKKRPLGIRMDFDGEAVRFASESPAEMTGSVSTLADKMASALVEEGPLSTGVLALSLGVDPAAIRTQLGRNRGRFTRDDRGFIGLRGDDGPNDEKEGLREVPF